jgi:hypothetical protein
LRPEEGEGEEGEGYRERERRWWRVSNRKLPVSFTHPPRPRKRKKNLVSFCFFCTGRLC